MAREPPFPGGVGNTWGSAENFATLIDDVETKLFDRFDDDTWSYPGHGDDTTIGAERVRFPRGGRADGDPAILRQAPAIVSDLARSDDQKRTGRSSTP